MKIPGATILRPTLAPPERLRDLAPERPPFVAEERSEPLVQRPASEVDQAAVIYLRDRYPGAAAQAAAQRYAQRAVAVYESVEQLRPREGLYPIQGIDELA